MKTQNFQRVEYRTVKLDIFLDPQSLHWFYEFPFDWVWYRSNQGYKTRSDACEAGKNHIDEILAEHAVEI